MFKRRKIRETGEEMRKGETNKELLYVLSNKGLQN